MGRRHRSSGGRRNRPRSALARPGATGWTAELVGGACGIAATAGDQRALGNSARLRVRRRAGGRRDRRRPTWGSHRGLRSSTSSDRCHPSSAGCRRSRRPGQPMRCAGMCGRRDDGACADRDQPQPGSGGAGALPGGIAGGRGRGRRRGAATGIHEGPAAASRTAGTRGLRLRRRSVLASAARRVLGVLPRAGSGRHGRAA